MQDKGIYNLLFLFSISKNIAWLIAYFVHGFYSAVPLNESFCTRNVAWYAELLPMRNQIEAFREMF
jgi:hypothetical protein